jgi:uncharacterized protein DUF6491
MRSVPITALACAASVLSGDAGAVDRSPAGKTCITRREINAISSLDDRHALARLSAGRLSLLTLDHTCRGLRSARTLVLERSAGRICGDGTSLLSFEELGVGPTRCRIEKIESVANKAEALELIASRAGPR